MVHRVRVAFYARISEDKTGAAAGVTRQIEDAKKLANDRGWTVVAEHVDNDISALKGKHRPGYSALMESVRAGQLDAIIVFHTSRLWRNRRERAEAMEVLRDRHVSVVAVKGPALDLSTAAGRMIAGVLGEFDTAESEIKSERVARAARWRAENGLYTGGRRAYGFGSDGYSIVPDEAAEIVSASKQILVGMPLAALVRDMNARGVPTVTGVQWDPNTLRSVLLRARNAGLSVHRGEIVGVGKWPAIVSEDVWRAVVAILTDPSRRTSTGNRASYLLSGIAICGVCENSITSAGVKYSRAGEASTRYIYRCRTNNCVGRRRDWIDQFVAGVVIERLRRPDARDLLVDNDHPDIESLRMEASALRTRLEDAAASYADDKITATQLEIVTKRIRSRLAEIESTTMIPSRAAVLADVVTSEDVEAAWNAAGLDRQRAIVRTLMDVAILPGGGGSREFDPSKVRITWKS